MGLRSDLNVMYWHRDNGTLQQYLDGTYVGSSMMDPLEGDNPSLDNAMSEAYKSANKFFTSERKVDWKWET